MQLVKVNVMEEGIRIATLLPIMDYFNHIDHIDLINQIKVPGGFFLRER